jgi:hypothetical protein
VTATNHQNVADHQNVVRFMVRVALALFLAIAYKERRVSQI